MVKWVHWIIWITAENSKSLICWKRVKGGKRQKRRIWLAIRLLAKIYLISGNVLNPESEGSAQSHNNCFQYFLKFLNAHNFWTESPTVCSYTSQNDHKSKGYPSKAAFTMQKSDNAPWAPAFEIDFQKFNFSALIWMDFMNWINWMNWVNWVNWMNWENWMNWVNWMRWVRESINK